MTATTRPETPLLPPKDRSDTNRPFSWAVVLAPTSMNDSDRREESGDERNGPTPDAESFRRRTQHDIFGEIAHRLNWLIYHDQLDTVLFARTLRNEGLRDNPRDFYCFLTAGTGGDDLHWATHQFLDPIHV